MKDRHPALWFVLLSCVLAPLLIASLWGDVYADAAYQQFQRARAIARGVEPPHGTSNFSPLYTLLLAPTTTGQVGLTPRIALALSATSWAVAVLVWFGVGLALGRPTFALAISVLLALHPLQAQVLGLESGLVLALWGLTTLLLASWLQRTGPNQKRASWLAGVASLTTLALLLTQPIMLSFLAPLLICGLLLYSRSALNLTHVAASVALGVACCVLLCILRGDWPPDEARSMTLLLTALQLLAAAGFAFLVPRLGWLAQPWGDKYALQRGVISLGLVALVYWQGHTLLQDWRLRPTDRLASCKELGQWLQEHTLPTETVGAQHAGWLGYLSDRAALALPDARQPTRAILDSITSAPPDHCVALNSLAWRGVYSHPWFKQHYQQVHQLATPYDSATPLTVWRYTPIPSDSGETVSTDLRFFPSVSDAQDQIRLLGYTLDTQRLTPGAPLHLALDWRAQTTIQQELFLVLRLVEPATGQVWTQTENFELYTAAWHEGTQFTDHYVLIPPDDLPPGDYALEVAFYPVNDSQHPVLAAGAGQAPRSQHLTLAQVYRPPSVSSVPPTPDHALEATFDHEIALLGYDAPGRIAPDDAPGRIAPDDAPGRIAPGETLRVALYWRALQPVTLDYKVFVHLLAADGSVLSQSDSMPVQWTYPTTQWQPGEYIRDEHVLSIDLSAPRGDYTLSVGLYDPLTGERLVTFDAAGNEIASKSVILLQIQVR